MNALYRFFRSVRLAVVLLLVITLLSILSTLVPQGQPEEFYRSTYPQGLAALILATRFNSFFRSIPFLILIALFVTNLGVCTVDRLLVRHRSGAVKRYGPDFIHVAILVLVVGGVTSTLVRREKYFTMGVGDSVEISGGYRMELLAFDFLKYDSGMPKDWVSTVSVVQDGKPLLASYGIEVNRPLRLGLLRVYQTNYETDGVVHLRDSKGATVGMSPGEAVESGDTALVLAGFERSAEGEYVGIFEQWRDRERVAVIRLAKGADVGEYRIDGVAARELTGLTAVSDPGSIPVLAALLIGTIGMALTFIQKRGERAK